MFVFRSVDMIMLIVMIFMTTIGNVASIGVVWALSPLYIVATPCISNWP